MNLENYKKEVKRIKSNYRNGYLTFGQYVELMLSIEIQKEEVIIWRKQECLKRENTKNCCAKPCIISMLLQES